MKLKKLIADPITMETVEIADSTYVLLLTEEWVLDPIIAEQFFFYGRIDYIRFRKYCKSLADTMWEDLDADSRHICVDNYVKPVALSWEATGYTDEELFIYWTTMVDKERECRIARMKTCMEKITWFFTGEESMKALDDIYLMVKKWEFGEYPELYCFVNSLNLTILGKSFDHSTTGFASKDYYTLDRLNLVNQILFND